MSKPNPVDSQQTGPQTEPKVVPTSPKVESSDMNTLATIVWFTIIVAVAMFAGYQFMSVVFLPKMRAMMRQELSAQSQFVAEITSNGVTKVMTSAQAQFFAMMSATSNNTDLLVLQTNQVQKVYAKLDSQGHELTQQGTILAQLDQRSRPWNVVSTGDVRPKIIDLTPTPPKQNGGESTALGSIADTRSTLDGLKKSKGTIYYTDWREVNEHTQIFTLPRNEDNPDEPIDITISHSENALIFVKEGYTFWPYKRNLDCVTSWLGKNQWRTPYTQDGELGDLSAEKGQDRMLFCLKPNEWFAKKIRVRVVSKTDPKLLAWKGENNSQ